MSDLQLRTARAIKRINDQITESNSKATKTKFEAEKKIAEVQANILAAQILIYKAQLEQSNLATGAFFEDVIAAAEFAADAITKIRNAQAPSALTGVDGVGVGDVATDRLDALEARSIELVRQRVAAQLEGVAQGTEAAFQNALTTISGYLDDVENKTNAAIIEQNDAVERTARISELVGSGLSRENAERVQAVERQRDIQKAVLETTRASIESELATTKEVDRRAELNKQLERTLTLLGGIDEKYQGVIDSVNQSFQLEERKQMFEEIANVIGNGIVDALKLVIKGTEDLGDALKELGAQILETIGQMLILKAIEAGVDALSSSLFPSPTPTGKLPNLQLAEGGFVTRPTTALVAEGGQPEYVIPASKMTGAMNRFNAGASGDAVINGADPTGETNITGAADIPITISTGPVMQFEGKNYVSQEEFAAGIKLAAKEGEAATLRRLRMSPSTRRKVGL